MDVSGIARLSFSGVTYTLGTVTRYSETFNKSVTVVPFPTLSEEDSLAVETASMRNITLDFIRVQPEYVNNKSQDMRYWDNKTWYEAISGIVDRWQARTDGFVLEYNIPDISKGEYSNPYNPSISCNGYVKSLSRQYNPGRNTELVCSMEFHVGTMYVETNTPSDAISTLKPRSKGEFYILMSNANQTEWNLILNGEEDINCVESYEMHGGLGCPFEYITMHIPKKRLTSLAPNLATDNSIIAGRNRVLVNAVGRSSMTVVKCKLSKTEYVVTAYCDAAILRGLGLAKDHQDSAFAWIKKILCDGKYGVAFREGTSETDLGNFIYAYDKSKATSEQLQFKKGTSVWYVLQTCAMYLGCRLFFAGDNAYLIDYRPADLVCSAYPKPILDRKSIDLYPPIKTDPMYGRVTGKVSLGNEGSDTIRNVISIKCTDADNGGKQTEFQYKSDASVDSFQEHGGDLIHVPTLMQGGGHDQAGVLARNMLDYYDEPQQSVTFTVKEMEKRDGNIVWMPLFDPSAALKSIRADADEIYINNKCELKNSSLFGYEKPQKLILSQFTHRYPSGTTEYTFGQMASIDLSSSTSQINNNLNNL